jgi:hypothetical protein
MYFLGSGSPRRKMCAGRVNLPAGRVQEDCELFSSQLVTGAFHAIVGTRAIFANGLAGFEIEEMDSATGEATHGLKGIWIVAWGFHDNDALHARSGYRAEKEKRWL